MIVGLACPNISLTTFTGTREASIKEAAVWPEIVESNSRQANLGSRRLEPS